MQRELCSELTNFSKSKLNESETRITNVDGEVFLETGSTSGNRLKSHISKQATGYVIDSHADLQVAEVLSGLIMGSQDIAHDPNIINKFQVTHILNAATGISNLFSKSCRYKNLEILDNPWSNIVQYFGEAFEFIDEGRCQGCCLVHCNAGVSRAASIVIGYVMEREHMTYAAAYTHVKERRPCISPNLGFVKQLQNYERLLSSQENLAKLI